MERTELIRHCMEPLKNAFDEKESMIVENYKHWAGGYHTRRTGRTHVVRSTADYAAAVLILGISEQYPQAFRALEKICLLQDAREESRTFGLWPYYLEEDLGQMLAPDYNWSDFIGKDLIGVCLLRGELLSTELRERLYRAVRNAMQCSIRRNVAADYTNISIMGSMTLISAGELLRDEELFEIGKKRLKKLSEYTRYNGAFSEYNSSAYLLVAMNEIMRMLAFFRDEECRKMAEDLNDTLWEMLSTHYNLALGQLTPPQTRAYRNLENGSLAWAIWQGTGGRFGKDATEEMLKNGAVSLESLCFPPKCPEKMLPYFEEKTRFLQKTYYRKNQIRSIGEDVTIIRELDSPDLMAFSYQEEYYSMGAFSFCDTWNQRRNCMVLWDRRHPKYFRLRCINGNYDFCSGVVWAVQDHQRVLGHLGLVTDRGSFHYILDREKTGRYQTDALYFVFELGGDTGDLRIQRQGDSFVIQDGSMRIVLRIAQWIFDGQEKEAELSADGKSVLLPGYHGETKWLDTTRLGDTAGVFTLTAKYEKREAGEQATGKPEARALEVSEEAVAVRKLSGGKLSSHWRGLRVESWRCAVPYRRALGLDAPDRTEMVRKLQIILDRMKRMEADGSVRESCPISIISMDAWEWPQGVALFAMYQYYRESGDVSILEYLKEWYAKQISRGLPEQNINTTCPMLTLACLYEETGNTAYLPVLEQWGRGVMEELPRTPEGGLQHIVSGVRNDGQLWDDTLYMAVIFLAKLGQVLKRDDYIQESIRQFMIHLKYLTDSFTGLFFHGWSFQGRHHFANALWGRGNAWYTAGLVDYLEFLDGNDGIRKVLIGALQTQVEALEGLQDESGLWHTLLNDPSSYLETSASCAFAYGILKAVRLGYLPARFVLVGEKALKGVLAKIREDGTVEGVSYGTPVFRTLQEYREVPICPMPYGQSMALMLLVEALKA